MESNNKNKFIRVSYALYDVTKGDNGEEMLIERTTDERPFFFISGMGVTLPAFEEKVVDLAEGEEFDFELDPEQAYGLHYDERVIDLDKQIVGFLKSDDNILQASTAQDTFKIGALAMENAIKSLKGEAVDKEIIVPGLTLSRTNPEAVAEYAKTVK